MDNRYRSFGSFEPRLSSSIVCKLKTQTFWKAFLKSKIARIEHYQRGQRDFITRKIFRFLDI